MLKTARYVDSEEVIETGEILLFVNPAFIISVRHGEASGLAGVRRRVEDPADLLRCGPATVLYAILDQIVDDYEVAAEGVEDDIQDVERQVFAPERINPAERIYRLEREVLDFDRAVAPLSPGRRPAGARPLPSRPGGPARLLPRRPRPPAAGAIAHHRLP